MELTRAAARLPLEEAVASPIHLACSAHAHSLPQHLGDFEQCAACLSKLKYFADKHLLCTLESTQILAYQAELVCWDPSSGNAKYEQAHSAYCCRHP